MESALEAARAAPGVLQVARRRLLEAAPGLVSWVVVLSPIWIGLVFGSLGAAAVAIGVLAFEAYFFVRGITVAVGILRTLERLRGALTVDWLRRCQDDADLRPLDLHHLCIIPTYTEPYAVLEATVQAIVDAKYPQHLKMVGIITRETDLPGWENVGRLRDKFGSRLGGFHHIKDPLEPGVLPGKSAAMNWGGRWMTRVLREQGLDLSRVLCTDLDSDYRVHPQYFAWISWHHVREPGRDFVIWQPLPLFHNNIWEVPGPIRVMSLSISQWQMYLHSRPKRLVAFSSYTCTLDFADRIGYWDTDVIPEDSRFYWKAFFAFGERFAVRSVPLPLYGDSPKARDYAATLSSQYKQILRWAWGITDIHYVMTRFFKHPEIPIRLRARRFFDLAISNHLTWTFFPVLLLFGASIPVWVSVDFSITDLGLRLWIYSSLIMTGTMALSMISIYVEHRLLPPKPARWGLPRRALCYVNYLTLPVVALFLSALPAFEAHTRLLLGKYLEYKVTEKGA